MKKISQFCISSTKNFRELKILLLYFDTNVDQHIAKIYQILHELKLWKREIFDNKNINLLDFIHYHHFICNNPLDKINDNHYHNNKEIIQKCDICITEFKENFHTKE